MKLTTIAVISFMVAVCFANTQEKQQKKYACDVAITSPHNGDRVSEDGSVVGTATIPPGTHLWVFAHRRGLGLWWPQGGGSSQIKGERWEALVTYGLPRDAGSDFEVTTAVVDDEENSHLLNWVKKAEETGQYPGIRLPASIEGCPTPRLTLTKER